MMQYDRGVELQRKGDLEGAERAFSSALERNPRMAAAYVNRSGIRLMKFDADGALRDYSAVIGIDPELPDASLGCGVARPAMSAKSDRRKELLKQAEGDVVVALSKGGKGWENKAKAEAALKQIRADLERLGK